MHVMLDQYASSWIKVLNVVLIVSPGLAELERATQLMHEQYYSLNSKLSRSKQIRKYFAFIEEFVGIFIHVPCPPSQVSLYIAMVLYIDIEIFIYHKLHKGSKFLFEVSWSGGY